MNILAFWWTAFLWVTFNSENKIVNKLEFTAQLRFLETIK